MNQNKWLKLVSKLLEATQENTIRWTIQPTPDNMRQLSDRVDHVCDTIYLDRNFRLYEYKTKHYVDEDRFEWVDGVRLEFVDFSGRALFEVPRTEGLWDLLRAVQYQTADIDSFLIRVAG